MNLHQALAWAVNNSMPIYVHREDCYVGGCRTGRRPRETASAMVIRAVAFARDVKRKHDSVERELFE